MSIVLVVKRWDRSFSRWLATFILSRFFSSKYLGDWTSVGGFRDIWILKRMFFGMLFSKFFSFRFDRGLF